MMSRDRATTIVSTKGQVVLPAAIRKRKQWAIGTQLTVEDTPEGVLLRSVSLFPETRPDDVFACLPCDGPPKTIEEMNEGVLAEARRRHAGD
ncbi:hypothetical protein FACS1894205_1940 [Alphaproteobacteria bacterium]|nr:hypothetical protein FACS1894205_1940 [Alphaproteobacteria bacterium]